MNQLLADSVLRTAGPQVPLSRTGCEVTMTGAIAKQALAGFLG